MPRTSNIEPIVEGEIIETDRGDAGLPEDVDRDPDLDRKDAE